MNKELLRALLEEPRVDEISFEEAMTGPYIDPEVLFPPHRDENGIKHECMGMHCELCIKEGLGLAPWNDRDFSHDIEGLL